MKFRWDDYMSHSYGVGMGMSLRERERMEMLLYSSLKFTSHINSIVSKPMAVQLLFVSVLCHIIQMS